MALFPRAVRHLALLLPLALLAPTADARDAAIPADPPKSLQTGDETPWLYKNSDIPHDKEWLFGKMDNGVRYAVRHNGVPPHQVSIRIVIDAGSLYETDSERGYAHLMEHLSFRESKYLGPAMAIPTWQRLGATFGSDTNAETSPTQTVYKLDLPNATPAALEESFKLLSGMMRDPVLNKVNVDTEVPIVLAEKRENGGAAQRVAERTRETLFAGQRLADRLPIGTEATLKAATPAAIQAFHDRWYRPENTYVIVAGDGDPIQFANLVEKWFGDWKGKGPHVAAPDFGDPKAPAGATGANPVGETAVMVEPDLPRDLTYAIMRPWRPVNDTIVYNQGLMLDSIAQEILNERLEERARAGGSYVVATVNQSDISRSTDATAVDVVPLDKNWRAALRDVRQLIADSLATPPTQDEIDRQVSRFEVGFSNQVEQRSVLAGSRIADELVNAIDIRETVASPETVLSVLQGMKAQFTPNAVLAHMRTLFQGTVVHGTYVTPATGEADAASLKAALEEKITANPEARTAQKTLSFADLPPVGPPGAIVSQRPLGVLGVERVEFANGVTALLSADKNEPGRVAVRVRFGAGARAFDARNAVYRTLGDMALMSSGESELDQNDLDHITAGGKLQLGFDIEDGVFSMSAMTRGADLDDQLYLFAAKLGLPRWDPKPVQRAQAIARLTYESYATNPTGVLTRDLEYYLSDRDPAAATPDLAALAAATPEGFEKTWAPLLRQGPVEVSVYGDFDHDAALETLRKTFGALPPRKPIPAEVESRVPHFPPPGDGPIVLHHRGDANQAAAVVAWPTGGGVAALPDSRKLTILTQIFTNRLLDAMRERAGASYSPQVFQVWPVDVDGGGRIQAGAQVKPEDVPVFFAAADRIAADLVSTPVSQDDLDRAVEPLRQQLDRASTSMTFLMYQLDGASRDPARIKALRSLFTDYTVTTPEEMQALAKKYLGARAGFRLAVIPEGQDLATGGAERAAMAVGAD